MLFFAINVKEEIINNKHVITGSRWILIWQYVCAGFFFILFVFYLCFYENKTVATNIKVSIALAVSIIFLIILFSRSLSINVKNNFRNEIEKLLLNKINNDENLDYANIYNEICNQYNIIGSFDQLNNIKPYFEDKDKLIINDIIIYKSKKQVSIIKNDKIFEINYNDDIEKIELDGINIYNYRNIRIYETSSTVLIVNIQNIDNWIIDKIYFIKDNQVCEIKYNKENKFLFNIITNFSINNIIKEINILI